MNLIVWSHPEPGRAGLKSVMALVLTAALPLALLQGASVEPIVPAAVSAAQIQPPSAMSAGGSEWGKPVEGLSVRLVPEKPVTYPYSSGWFLDRNQYWNGPNNAPAFFDPAASSAHVSH